MFHKSMVLVDLTSDSHCAAPHGSKSRLGSRQGQIKDGQSEQCSGWERRMKRTQGMDVCRMSGRAKQSMKQQQGTIDGGGEQCSVKAKDEWSAKEAPSKLRCDSSSPSVQPGSDLRGGECLVRRCALSDLSIIPFPLNSSLSSTSALPHVELPD